MNEMDSFDDNIYSHTETLRRSLLGRYMLSQGPDNKISQDPADVFIVKSILDGLGDSEHDSESSRPTWLRKTWRYILHRVSTNSRTTHWAAEIRGDLYETFRRKEYFWPWKWKAVLKLTVEDDWKKERRRRIVERLHIGTTALGDVLQYELHLRPYSIFGDNCQQFMLQFCQEISVEFNENASSQLHTATSISKLVRWSISLLCLLFVLDIFGNKGRFSLATSTHAAVALLGMILLTFSHPRMFLFDVSHLPFLVSHFIHLLVNSFVLILWVAVGAVLCFSFERDCDLVAVRMVDGIEVFDIWHSCNLVLRATQFLISVVCYLGWLYHVNYNWYFIVGR